jgi:hypothetical protein
MLADFSPRRKDPPGGPWNRLTQEFNVHSLASQIPGLRSQRGGGIGGTLGADKSPHAPLRRVRVRGGSAVYPCHVSRTPVRQADQVWLSNRPIPATAFQCWSCSRGVLTSVESRWLRQNVPNQSPHPARPIRRQAAFLPLLSCQQLVEPPQAGEALPPRQYSTDVRGICLPSQTRTNCPSTGLAARPAKGPPGR